MLVAVAAMAFVSCSNDNVNDVPSTRGFEVTVNAHTVDTRSEFGEYNSTDKTYPTFWEGTEEWFVAVNDRYTEAVKDINFSDDFKSASANFTFTEAPTASTDGTYTLYAISPVSAWSSYKFEDDYLRFYIARNIQTPTEISCDPASQVLFAKSEAMDSADSFNVSFEHLSAYAKFSFKNVAEGGVVSSVSVTAEDVNLAGRYAYTLSTGALAEYDRLEKSITLVTNETENLWLSIAPVDVSGKTLTFAITTDKGILSKEVTMPANAKFESGKVVSFNVDMEGIEYPSADSAETWQLVTNKADITDGEYIIVGENNTGNIVYLPSTTTTAAPTQKIISSINGLDLSSTEAFSTTLIPEDARFTFSVSNGKATVTNAEGKYLYTTNSNSGLRIDTTNDTWSFAAHSSDAKSIVMQSASQSRYITIYNAQDWRCYTRVYDKTNSQNGVTYLYKKVSKEPYFTVTPTEYTFEANGGEHYFNINSHNGYNGNVTATSTADWLLIDQDGYAFCVEADTNDGKAREATITFTDGNKSVTVTVKQEGKAITSISEALESADATAVKFENVTVAATYTKGVLVTDGSAYILVYKGSEISNAVIGSVVTVEGTMGTYGGLRQVASPTVEINGSTNYQHPTAEVFDANDFAAFISSPSVKYVEYTGTLNISGNYYNVKIEGTENQEGSISYPKSDAINADDNGKKITVRGYTIGVSSNKYVNTMLVDYNVVTGGDEDDDNTGGNTGDDNTGGDVSVGDKYSFDVTEKVWSSWNTGVKCGSYTWTPEKISVNGNPTVGNKDSSGRGQQFGAAKTNQIKTMTMTCSDYKGGVKSIDVKACAKSGNTITASVTVGGVEMTSTKNSATISESNSSSIATLSFTSDKVLSGDIVITYTLTTAGALYVSGFGINNN